MRGRDINQYHCNFADLWLIVTHNGNKASGQPPVNINEYPAIKAHLDKYYEKLAQRYDKGDTPYNLRNCIYMDDFFKPKIIFQEIVQEPAFVLDINEHFYCLDTGRIIVGENLEYLVTLLNSKLFFYAIKHYYGGGALGSSGVRMKHTFFEKFSAYTPTPADLTLLKQYVLNKDFSKIDEFYYKKYSLNEEEIKLIEKDLCF